MIALQAFLLSGEEAEGGAASCVLSGEQLARVRSAGRRSARLLEGIAPFETVLQLVEAMAGESGSALLRLLQNSQSSGEDVMNQLTELVEGALTIDTLEHISLANTWLQPLVVAGLRIQSKGRLPEGVVTWHRKEWGFKLLDMVEKAKSLKSLVDIAIETLRQFCESGRDAGHAVALVDSIRSALRHGLVVEQKIQEAEDDSAAVRNVIRGMMDHGRLVLEASPGGSSGFAIQAEYTFLEEAAVLNEQRLTECADKAMLAVPQTPRQQERDGAPTGGRISADAVMIFTQVGFSAALQCLLPSGII